MTCITLICRLRRDCRPDGRLLRPRPVCRLVCRTVYRLVYRLPGCCPCSPAPASDSALSSLPGALLRRLHAEKKSVFFFINKQLFSIK